MKTNNIEELISIINPNTLQCEKCKKWFNKNEPNNYNYNRIKLINNCDYVRFYGICSKCYSKKSNLSL